MVRQTCMHFLKGFLLIVIFSLGACVQRQVAVQVPDYSPQYCYKTLAEVDCHKEPLEGEDNRRVDWYEEPKGYQSIERTVNCLSFFSLLHCPDAPGLSD